MKSIKPNARFFAGVVSLERGERGVKPWRLPVAKRALFAAPDDVLAARAERAAGVRLRFETDASAVSLVCTTDAPNYAFDITHENRLLQTVRISETSGTVRFDALPPGLKTMEIWLPVAAPVWVRGLQVERGAVLRPVADPRPRWITYGSSITHCGSAHSPARTWPATAARLANLNLTCLGYGGSCHLEPMVARMIRDLPPAALISLKVGINIQGGAALSPRTFKAAVIGFIQILREKHRTTPLVVISPILSPPRETTDNAVGLSLTKMRIEIEDAVRRVQETCGDRNLYYVSGLELFGTELAAAHLPDQLHPDGDGYEAMGRNFVEKVLARIPRRR